MILTIKINVEDKIEAYEIVSEISFKHAILEADLDGTKETFDKDNPAVMFLKDNTKHAKQFQVFKK